MGHREKELAFTLVELMVVIAVIGVISSMLIPAVAKAKNRAHLVHCYSNKRQVHQASMLYSADYNDWFTPVSNFTEENATSGFIEGLVDLTQRSDNTNYVKMLKGSPQNGAPAVAHRYLGMKWQVFKCPSDKYIGPLAKQIGHKYRVRSIAQNYLLGPIAGWAGMNSTFKVRHHSRSDVSMDGTKSARDKVSEVKKPSFIWMWTDCHPSYVRSSFVPTRYWIDDRGVGHLPQKILHESQPGNLHSGGAAMIFVDGHVELKKWEGYNKTLAIWYDYKDRKEDPDLIPGTSTYRDWKWLVTRMTDIEDPIP